MLRLASVVTSHGFSRRKSSKSGVLVMDDMCACGVCARLIGPLFNQTLALLSGRLNPPLFF